MIAYGIKIFGKIDKKQWARIIVFTAIFLTVADSIYMNINGITQDNRDKCVIFNSIPRWLFFVYEYFFEFLIVVLLGVFAGGLIELYFKKVKRFFPKNQVLAFVYGSILPVCSCGVIPMIEAMKSKVSLRVILTFVIAAPLLNPYIIFVSFSVLGLKYGVLRIISSFILAIGAGFIVELIARKYKVVDLGEFHSCQTDCTSYEPDLFVKTINITKKLIPYILVGGVLSFALEYINPKQFLETFSFSNNAISMLIMTAIGVPLYVCNGADVLLLKPLLAYTDLSLGAAMTFSLTSTVVCVSSIVMLLKFLGKKLTIILVSTLVIITWIIGFLINLI